MASRRSSSPLGLLEQSTQLQVSPHIFPCAKQSQYSFRHFDLEQLHDTFAAGCFRFYGMIYLVGG
jgi:hypothetical protein